MEGDRGVRSVRAHDPISAKQLPDRVPLLPGHDILEIRGSRHKSTDLSNPTGHDLRPI